MEEDQGWVRLAGAARLGAGEMAGFSVGAQRIALYHLADGGWRASEDRCTHGQACLTEGYLEGNTVECPLHGGRFDLATGAGLGSPIFHDLVLYPVRVEGADVLVRPGASKGGASEGGAS